MSNIIQSMILGLREGLEASLIVVIILRYLSKTNRDDLRQNTYKGIGIGIAGSIIFGLLLYLLSNLFENLEGTVKLWESIASLAALVLITTFIVFMINKGRDMRSEIEHKVMSDVTPAGMIMIVAIMIGREGVEIALFSFAGEYPILPILIGVIAAIIISVLIYRSLLKVDIKVIFNVTLIYLILQAGFLLGYGYHEGVAALKDIGVIANNSFLTMKAFDLSGTFLDHKEGPIGIAFHVLTGWYSKPEWIQLILHYGYVTVMLSVFISSKKRKAR